MRFRWLDLLFSISLLGLTACSSNSSNPAASSGSGLLYLASQGNQSISAYSLALSSGSLASIGSSVATGSTPSAMAVTPAIDAVFVANTGANTVSSYTVNSDGSLTAGTATPAGKRPMGLAIDPAGKFLFVANQGSNDVSVFTISGASLKQVAGSPFTTIPPGSQVATGPVSVAVPPAGSYVYVANQFTNTLSGFAFNRSGFLTPVAGSPYPVESNPSTVAISPNGNFLLVANAGSGTISSFAICAAVSATCLTPDGTATPVGKSSFPAGLEPVAIAFDPGFSFVYVADQRSNEVWQYSFSNGTGVLSALSPPGVSTGTSPVAIVVRSGATGVDVGNPTTNPTDYVYVANIGGSSLSGFTLTTSSGLLDVLGSPVTTAGQPAALAVK